MDFHAAIWTRPFTQAEDGYVLDFSFSAIRAVSGGLVRLTLALAVAMQFVVGYASTPEATTRHVIFNEPALSPNGRSVAVQAFVSGLSRSKLVLLDVETGSVRVFDQPRDQTWRSPSFSPSGDRLAFLQICRFECASGPKGVHIAVLDLQSGRDTTVTASSNLIRMDPVFAPGGRFVVYGAVQIDNVDQRSFPKSIYNRAYGFYTKSLLIVDLETGIESEILPGKSKEVQFMQTRRQGFWIKKHSSYVVGVFLKKTFRNNWNGVYNMCTLSLDILPRTKIICIW